MTKERRKEPEGFAEFWAVWRKYARHTDGRGLAREAFSKHVRAGADPQDIIAGAMCFFRTMKDRDREYVPLSATWLNREAYTDLAEQEREHQERINAAQQRRSENVVPIREAASAEIPEERRREAVARARAMMRGQA